MPWYATVVIIGLMLTFYVIIVFLISKYGNRGIDVRGLDKPLWSVTTRKPKKEEEVKGMKRYTVFAFFDYYPSGGWGDFVAAFDDLDAARKCARECISVDGYLFPAGLMHFDNSEVIDLEKLEEVFP